MRATDKVSTRTDPYFGVQNIDSRKPSRIDIARSAGNCTELKDGGPLPRLPRALGYFVGGAVIF